MRVRGPLTAVTMLALAAGLSGCGAGGGAGVAISELAVPAALQPAGPVVDDASIVSPTKDLPWLVSAIRTEPGGTPHAAVWTSGKDGTFAAKPVLLDVDGSVRTLAAAGNNGSTAVAGSVWTGRAEHAFLLRSTDRKTWAPVELPAEVATAELSQATAVAGGLVAVGVDPASQVVTGVRLDADGEPTILGAIEGKGRPTVVGVAGNGSALLVAVEWDRGAGTPVETSYRSGDDGKSWRTVKVPGTDASVTGVATTDDAFVLTGSVRGEGDDAPISVPAAWFWDFGAPGWEELDLTISEGGENQEFSLAPPAQNGPTLAALLQGSDLRSVPIVTDQGGGISSRGQVTDNDGVGFTGPSAWSADGRTVRSVLVGDGSARVVQFAGEKAAQVSVLTDVQRWSVPDSTVHADGATLPVTGRGFEPKGDTGWRRWDTSAAVAPDADGTALVEAHDRPKGVTQAATVSRDVAPDGTQVLVAADWTKDHEKIASTPYVRRSDAGAWTAADPLPGKSKSDVAAVRWVPGLGDDGAWLAVGHQADSTEIGAKDRVAAWTSSDGTTWRDASASLKDGSAAGYVCLLPDGSPLVLGRAAAGSVWADVAWAIGPDGWKRTTIDKDDELDVEGCVDATDDRDAVLQVTTGGRTELRTTADGATFEPLSRSAEGQTFGPVAAVGDGLAAVGTTITAGTAETTLWYSADGVTWGRRSLPATVPATGTVHPIGDGDAVVTVDDPGGVEAWYVTGVADFVGGSPQQARLAVPAKEK